MTAQRPPGLWRLVAAGVVDSLVGAAAWSLAAVWILIVVWGSRRAPLGLGGMLLLVATVLLLGPALHIAYHTVFVGGCGQTPGKMLLGLAVVRRDGAAAGYGRALLRCAAGLLCVLTLGLGRLSVLFTRERRGLPDLVAGTRVVRLSAGPSLWPSL